MEEAFPFEETPDQMQAIIDVKGDMERPVPMDRLVCGDVGYGKTEVAVRAAFKAVQEGTQVVVLVPTTLLAGQHGQTFRERFANYPVRVEVLSRFLTAKEQRAVVRDFESGAVDVLIGTHRLLSTDVKAKNLGLLVVDEEQRFGVQHKELIKQLATNVDVLTLTATPIPRTLELSLTGIRDLSLVNTPPEDRQPILTYVGEYDDRAAAEAIRRELLREGQVFYVHNRVRDIELVAENVRTLVPDARVAVAHGQMDESRLERVVNEFADREFDVLVCTTIVESGIDMPTVNTLVVDRSDLLGLAQLYQLRGRVGRRGQRAYAYLFHPTDQVLSEEAYERLKTIGEFTDLGSGFKIAMRDLEIRGAGNLLGQAQSGHIAAVGFDLYCQMVTEAVGELKGEPVPEPVDITIDVPVDANLPRDYVQRDDVRMEAYRRLAAVTLDDDVDDVRNEWEDRYGPPPPSAVALLDVASLRVECVRLGIRTHHRAAQHRPHHRAGVEGVAEGAAAPPGAQGGGQGGRAGGARAGGPGRRRDHAGRAAPGALPATRRGVAERDPRASLRSAMSRRRLAFASIAVVTVLCVVGVSVLAVAAGGSALAYEVNGTRVSQQTVDNQLDEFADNKGLGRGRRTRPGSVDSKITAQVLTVNIVLQLVRDAAERRGVKVTDADRRPGTHASSVPSSTSTRRATKPCIVELQSYFVALGLDPPRRPAPSSRHWSRRPTCGVDPKYGFWNPRYGVCARRPAARRPARTSCGTGPGRRDWPRTGRCRPPPAGGARRARVGDAPVRRARCGIPQSTISSRAGVTFTSFDDVYDAAPDLESAYGEIAARLGRRRARAR